MIEPKTWTDDEIIELMVKEARAYAAEQRESGHTVSYREMMECVLGVLKDHGLIEDTP